MAHKFDHTAPPPPMPPGASIDRAIPIRAPEVGGDVLVPLLRAVISGAMLAALSGVAALVIGWPWWVPVGVAGMFSVAVWFSCGLSDKLLWASEIVTGKDLDQDGRIGQPATVRVEVSDLDQRQLRFMELPGTPEALQQLAHGVLTGKTLAEAEWTGKGRPYSRNEFRDMRAQLLERGIVTWRNDEAPSQGVELTRVGRAVFDEIARTTRARIRPVAQIGPPAR